LVPNEFSLLDSTDLVSIDPVNTGFSKAEDPKQANEFLGVREDIQAVAEFIRLWLTREQRWLSPKFIAGESYGGIRGGGLAEHLASRHRIYINGLVIVLGLLDYDVLIGGALNDLPYQVLLPALTATAHYQQEIAREPPGGSVRRLSLNHASMPSASMRTCCSWGMSWVPISARLPSQSWCVSRA